MKRVAKSKDIEIGKISRKPLPYWKNSEPMLTPEQLSKRWKSVGYIVKVGTLANWRWKGTGPKFIKPSKEVFYPLAQVVAWEVAKGIRKVRHA